MISLCPLNHHSGPLVPGPLCSGLQDSQTQPLLQILIKDFPGSPDLLPHPAWCQAASCLVAGLGGLSGHRIRTCLPPKSQHCPPLPHAGPQEERAAPPGAETAASTSLEPRTAGTMPYKASGDGNPHQNRALGSGLEFGWGFSSLSLRLHNPELNISPHCLPQQFFVNLSVL